MAERQIEHREAGLILSVLFGVAIWCCIVVDKFAYVSVEGVTLQLHRLEC